jgi:hypothetical protein
MTGAPSWEHTHVYCLWRRSDHRRQSIPQTGKLGSDRVDITPKDLAAASGILKLNLASVLDSRAKKVQQGAGEKKVKCGYLKPFFCIWLSLCHDALNCYRKMSR